MINVREIYLGTFTVKNDDEKMTLIIIILLKYNLIT